MIGRIVALLKHGQDPNCTSICCHLISSLSFSLLFLLISVFWNSVTKQKILFVGSRRPPAPGALRQLPHRASCSYATASHARLNIGLSVIIVSKRQCWRRIRKIQRQWNVFACVHYFADVRGANVTTFIGLYSARIEITHVSVCPMQEDELPRRLSHGCAHSAISTFRLKSTRLLRL